MEKSFFLSSPFNKMVFPSSFLAFHPPCPRNHTLPFLLDGIKPAAPNPTAGQRGTEIWENDFFTISFQGRVSCHDYGMLLGTGLAVPYPEIRGELRMDASRVATGRAEPSPGVQDQGKAGNVVCLGLSSLKHQRNTPVPPARDKPSSFRDYCTL